MKIFRLKSNRSKVDGTLRKRMEILTEFSSAPAEKEKRFEFVGTVFKDKNCIVNPKEGPKYQDRTGCWVGVGRVRRGVGGEDVELCVKPKFEYLNPAKMFLEALPEIWRAEGSLESILRLRSDERPIAIKYTEEPTKMLLLFLIAAFASEARRVLPRLRKRAYRAVETNQTGRLKGKLLLTQHIRHNIALGRGDRAYCRTRILDEHNPVNRIINAALRQCLRILDSLWPRRGNPTNGEKDPVDDLSGTLRVCLGALQHIEPLSRLTPLLIAEARMGLRGFYAPLRRTFDLAVHILQGAGDSVLLEPKGDATVCMPPFAINMSKLYEFWVRHHVLKAAEGSWNVARTGSGEAIDLSARQIFHPECNEIRPRQPDILLEREPRERMVIEVKYHLYEKELDWFQQFGTKNGETGYEREQPRHGFFQTCAYMLLFGASRGAIIYPTSESKSELRAGDLGYEDLQNKLPYAFVGVGKDGAESLRAKVRELLEIGSDSKVTGKARAKT
jgi:hypothetical protein